MSSIPDLNSNGHRQLTHRNSWDPQTDHANGYTRQENGGNHSSFSLLTPNETEESKSPPSISIRSFLLGTSLGASLIFTFYLALRPSPLWRLPFFLSALSLFHFLEYQVTAIYNPPSATVAAFLLSSNGRAYNIAHTLAFFECGFRWYLFPHRQITSPTMQQLYLALGFMMMIIGQVSRTTAMAHAGASFNHVVQSRRKEAHLLVTEGIYGWLRHPSYFGFFWWGLGGQLVLGNNVCLVGYAVVLWRFFRNRIQKEEKFLIGFFGMDYVKYRDETGVKIPFIK